MNSEPNGTWTDEDERMRIAHSQTMVGRCEQLSAAIEVLGQEIVREARRTRLGRLLIRLITWPNRW